MNFYFTQKCLNLVFALQNAFSVNKEHDIIKKYEDVFNGYGKIKDFYIKLN